MIDAHDLQAFVDEILERGGMPESRTIAADATSRFGREVTIDEVNTILERYARQRRVMLARPIDSSGNVVVSGIYDDFSR